MTEQTHPARADCASGPGSCWRSATIPAVWYVFDYENDIDPELPRVVRPTFSTYPPPAYRFAEACDTIDHVAVYVSSAALVLSVWGLLALPALTALACGRGSFGGRFLARGHARPAGGRLVRPRLANHLRCPRSLEQSPHPGGPGHGRRGDRRASHRRTAAARRPGPGAREHGILGLLIVAAILMIMRQIGRLDWEPFGFWPRWFYVWGLFAWAFAIVKVVPPAPPRWSRAAIIGLMVVISLGLDFTGRGLFWYQRPIARLKEVVPGPPLSECHADLSRPAIGSAPLSLSHDHQPLPRAHARAEPTLAG